MLRTTVRKGCVYHPDPDVLVGLYHGFHSYDSLREADEAYRDGQITALELEAIEDGFIVRGDYG